MKWLLVVVVANMAVKTALAFDSRHAWKPGQMRRQWVDVYNRIPLRQTTMRQPRLCLQETRGERASRRIRGKRQPEARSLG